MKIFHFQFLPRKALDLCLLMFASTSLQAAVIAQYDFTGGPVASSDTETSTTASNFLIGATGVNASAGGPAFTNDRVETGGDDTVDGGVNYGSLNDAMTYAIANDSYLSFTVSIDSVTEVDLTSINFDYSSTGGFDFGFGVFSDKTGFTVGNELAGVFGNDGSSPLLGGPIDLSGITSLQNLMDTTVELRFYLTDRSGSNTRIHQLDSVSLEGNVSAIPEPSAFLLGSFGLLLLLRRRR